MSLVCLMKLGLSILCPSMESRQDRAVSREKGKQQNNDTPKHIVMLRAEKLSREDSGAMTRARARAKLLNLFWPAPAFLQGVFIISTVMFLFGTSSRWPRWLPFFWPRVIPDHVANAPKST